MSLSLKRKFEILMSRRCVILALGLVYAVVQPQEPATLKEPKHEAPSKMSDLQFYVGPKFGRDSSDCTTPETACRTFAAVKVKAPKLIRSGMLVTIHFLHNQGLPPEITGLYPNPYHEVPRE